MWCLNKNDKKKTYEQKTKLEENGTNVPINSKIKTRYWIPLTPNTKHISCKFYAHILNFWNIIHLRIHRGTNSLHWNVFCVQAKCHIKLFSQTNVNGSECKINIFACLFHTVRTSLTKYFSLSFFLFVDKRTTYAHEGVGWTIYIKISAETR